MNYSNITCHEKRLFREWLKNNYNKDKDFLWYYQNVPVELEEIVRKHRWVFFEDGMGIIKPLKF